MLMRRFQPEVIVLRKNLAGSSRDTPAVRAAIQSIRAFARALGVRVVSIDKRFIEKTFWHEAKLTKHETALLLAACFPVLTWYVPRKRKPWMPEDRRMQYFDATATGLAYFASNGDAEVVQQLLSDAESRCQSLVENT